MTSSDPKKRGVTQFSFSFLFHGIRLHERDHYFKCPILELKQSRPGVFFVDVTIAWGRPN